MCIGQSRCTLMSFWDLLSEMIQFRSDETSVVCFPAEVRTIAGIMWMIVIVLAAVNSVYKASGAGYGSNPRTCWWVWTSVEENLYSLDANMSSRSHVRYSHVKWAPKKESAVATPGMIIEMVSTYIVLLYLSGTQSTLFFLEEEVWDKTRILQWKDVTGGQQFLCFINTKIWNWRYKHIKVRWYSNCTSLKIKILE